MIPQIVNRKEESVFILSPTGQDQVAPRILSVLVGVVIDKLQHGATYAVVQVGSSWVVVGVEVIWIHVPHVTHWVVEAVRRIHGNGHGAPIVTDKEAKGVPLVMVAPGLKSGLHHLEVALYVPDEVQDLVRSIQAGLDPADNESHIEICDLLMLAVCLEDQEDGNSPTELWSAL